jgi:hypothetical protein
VVNITLAANRTTAGPIADPRILHLIQKWLKAGILEDGVVTVSENISPHQTQRRRGAVAS